MIINICELFEEVKYKVQIWNIFTKNSDTSFKLTVMILSKIMMKINIKLYFFAIVSSHSILCSLEV